MILKDICNDLILYIIFFLLLLLKPSAMIHLCYIFGLVIPFFFFPRGSQASLSGLMYIFASSRSKKTIGCLC
jgi:hypothetical protein